MSHLVAEEDLSDEFSMFGIDLDNPDVVVKLQELCTLYRLEAGDMVTEWVAFKSSHKAVTMEPGVLDMFERERLSKKNQKTPKAVKNESKQKVYTVDSLPMDVEGAEELYTAYGGTGGHTPTAKSKTAKRQHTPETGPIKRFTGPNRSPVAPFSPASFSPASVTPAKKYNSRTNKGEVIVSHGATDNVRWQGDSQEVSITHYNTEHGLSKHFKYMFQKLSEKFRVLDDIIEDMADHLKKSHETIEDYSHVSLPTQEEVTIVGRVCCDSNGKLNAKSVLLEGSVDMSSGKTVPVDLSQLNKYALFPGQIVAIDGHNSTGQKFVAKKLHESVVLPLPEVKSTEPGNRRLSVIVASGPFSTSDSLSYEPLGDLVQQIQQTKPDVCILMGPFVDEKNTEIENGKLTTTYEDLFRTQMEQIGSATEKLGCQVVVLPSHRDMHHDCVYPQPPYKLPNFNYKHIQFMPDPCTLCINDIVFGLTSTDVLFQLGGEEISFPPGSSDRLGRLTKHLLTQHSYYPYYPANNEMCVDYEQYQNYCSMTTTPHIFITPSEFKQFIKNIKGCCCINPGRLTKGLTGSTFAKMVIQVNNLGSNQSIMNKITAQVVRI